jgi:hypothetical protein
MTPMSRLDERLRPFGYVCTRFVVIPQRTKTVRFASLCADRHTLAR